MKPIITEQSFYKYLKCPSWIARELKNEGQFQEALIEKLQTEGLLREHELELLRDRNISEVVSEDMDEAALETLTLMKKGAETIYKGALVHGHWVGRPDVLEKVEGRSNFGNWYYVASDIKRSSQLKTEYKFQGVFYAQILRKLQGVRPVNGYVIHANGVVDSYLINDFYTEFHLTLDSIQEILDGEDKPHFLTSGCKQSPWFSECMGDSESCDSLSVLNRIWRNEAHSLEDAGIDTVSKLASVKSEVLKKVRGVSLDRLYFLQQQAISLLDKQIIRIGDIDLPNEDGVVLIIDIESDSLRDVDFMFGVLVVDGANETYHVFTAETPEDEASTWRDFLSFIGEYAGANIYHYGWYEVDRFRQLSAKYGVTEVAERMFSENMIDLLGRLRGSIIFPSPFYSLKDVAKHLGFKWRAGEVTGVDSIIWYEKWLNESDQQALQDIIDYNEDDVRATWYVIKWVKENLM